MHEQHACCMLIGSLHENGPIQLICMSRCPFMYFILSRITEGGLFCKNLTELAARHGDDEDFEMRNDQ